MNWVAWLRKKLAEKHNASPASGQDPTQVITDWNEEKLTAFFAGSSDVKIIGQRYHHDRSLKLVFVYCEGMVDLQKFQEWIIPVLDQQLKRSADWQPVLGEVTDLLQLQPIRSNEDMYTLLFSGQLLLLFESLSLMYSVNIPQIPQRNPEESTTEISIKGPRDAFTEELATNVALVRKRLRTPSLCNEIFEIGRRSRTKVSLMYIRDIMNPHIIQEARERLSRIEVDALLSSAQLEESLSDHSYSLFPLVDYIGRPDFIAQCLIRGRFAVLVDGSPMALIAPSNLTEQLKSPEDLHFHFYFVGFERLLRIVGLFVAIFAPGFWVALSAFNMEQLPFPLLATVTNSRIGLPTSAPLEALLMLFLFEIFREAGIRLPKAVGQTIAVVGGLIIGDAAIRAGLASPTMLIACSVTAVATFTLVNQTLSGAVSVLRIFVLLCASFLGLFGFFLAMFFIVVYLSGLRSFGLPYLAPLSPVSIRGLLPALLSLPWNKQKQRPPMLHPKDGTRQRGRE
ncbi:Spore germination protein XA [Paenibacillus konkukensis]|uniref:Spore germination protein XA n=1 Tax=Paenibacillus konkukensis TaxID=2020716 RepID=A0ABY4RT52_9BACL|nr:spore germination protein [Paenibacillus konkukensis]UQZ85293.1 Spore germination protein XA [Paenibacillus konkukensis]